MCDIKVRGTVPELTLTVRISNINIRILARTFYHKCCHTSTQYTLNPKPLNPKPLAPNPKPLRVRPKIVVCPRPWPQTMLGRSNPLALPVFSTSTWSYLLATSLHPFYKMDAPKLTLTVFFLRGICNLMPKSRQP